MNLLKQGKRRIRNLEDEYAKLWQMYGDIEAKHDRLREAATRLCGAASRVALAAPSSGPLWHGSREMKELQEALLSDELKKLMDALQEDRDE